MGRGQNSKQTAVNDASMEVRSDEGRPFASSRNREKISATGARIVRLCSYTGLLLLRKLRVVGRRTRRLGATVAETFSDMRQTAVRGFKIFAVRNGISLDSAAKRLNALQSGSHEAGQKGLPQQILYWITVAFSGFFRGTFRFFSSINYVAPLLGAVIFATVIGVTLNMTFALRVTYNGEVVGYIADESVFERAESQMKGRIVFEDYIRPADAIPEFSIAAIQEEQLIDKDQLANELIQASGNEISEATGLYIDDKFMGAVKDKQEIDRLLYSIKSKFSSGAENESIEFVKDVEPRDGLYPVTSIVDVRLLEEKLNQEESQQRIYTAVKGDAPTLIAQKNGVPYSKLKALNPDIEKKLLIGQEVLVEKAVPMLEVKVSRTETQEEEIPIKIEQIQDPGKYEGYVKIAQNGEKGIKAITSEVVYIDGVEMSRQVLDTRIVKEPVAEKVVVGGKRPLAEMPAGAKNSSSNFIWPTDGGYVSCGFAGYAGHTGMDIAGMSQGSAVRASAAGTVTLVQYSSLGYGYHVMINHGGGVQTLYGHNSKIYVKVGDWVEQGQLIAAMGRTGRATGVHVHFEIRVNGRYMNPASYIGTRCPY